MPRRKQHRNADQPTESEVRDAVAVITRDYDGDVQSIGDDLIQRIKDGEIPDSDSFHDALHEDVDGTARVIYTWQARLGLIASEHHDAFFEEGMGPLKCDESIPWEQLMYFAMERDVVEYMEREGFDPSDEATYETEEDEDE